jgi:hypothetical protein
LFAFQLSFTLLFSSKGIQDVAGTYLFRVNCTEDDMKKSKSRLPKKSRPKDLKRITNVQGERVWITDGKEYKSLADVPREK